MQITDLAEFNRMLDQLGLVFTKPPDDELRRVYFEALKQYPLAAIRERAKEHMATGKFFPKPTELRPALEKIDRDRGPPIGSVAWWSSRERVLREAFPKGLSAQSRAELDRATFGNEATPDELRQSAECYERAWPSTGRDAYREAQGPAEVPSDKLIAARRMARALGKTPEQLLAEWARNTDTLADERANNRRGIA